MKKKFRVLALTLAMCTMCTVPAMAKTVTYKGQNVYWDYGRKYLIIGYSDVQTHRFTHSATVNNKFSGWKKKGVEAYVDKTVGHSTVYAYWDCK